MRLPRHCGRQNAWLMNNTVWVQRSQTLPAEIAVNFSCTCRLGDYMRGFVPTLGQRRRALFIGFAIAGLKFDFLTPLLAGTDKLLNI